MKTKRLLSYLVTAAMLLALLPWAAVLPARAAEEPPTILVSGAEDFGRNWYDLYSGTWRLTEDVTISYGLSTSDSEKVILDLAGHRLQFSGENDSVVTVWGELTLTDSVGGGKLSGGEGGNVCGVTVAGGAFTMNGGTVTDCTASGVNVYGGSFRMLGGAIRGNRADFGGGVHLSQGNVESGGVEPAAGSFLMMGGLIEDNTANHGGGVFTDRLSSSGYFIMKGGLIRGNSATGNGGGVCAGDTGADGEQFLIRGGTILENTAGSGGGVYYCCDDDGAAFVMSGGSIIGNEATAGSGGGVCVPTGQFALKGGSITNNTVWGEDYHGGGVYFGESLTVSGESVVAGNAVLRDDGNGCRAENVFVPDGLSLSDDGLRDGACIGVFMENGGGAFAEGADESDGQTAYFTDDRACRGVTAEDGCLKLEDIGGWPTVATWDELYGRLESGGSLNIRLERDIENENNRSDKLHVSYGSAVVLDLAGQQLDGGMFLVDGSLTLVDSIGTGEIQGGVSIANDEGASFTMNGGTISGNTARKGGGVFVAHGGAFTMNGGTITGNTANDGGGVFVAYGGAFTMSGGEITGNTANDGGGVYAEDTFVMKGGAIRGNSANCGGGVFIGRGGVFTLTDGILLDNIAIYDGGGVHVNDGTFRMYGGTISGSTAQYGGGVHVNDGTFTMTGGTISGNNAKQDGGGVFVAADGAFTMSGGEVTGNNAKQDGGGVFVETGGAFKVSGAARVTGNFRGAYDASNGVYAAGESGVASNVYLQPSQYPVAVITVAGPLDEDAAIGVTTANSGAFTSGWSTHMRGTHPAAYFTSDLAERFIRLDEYGEAVSTEPILYSDGDTTAPVGSVLALAVYDGTGRLDFVRSVTLDRDCIDVSAENLLTLEPGYLNTLGSYKLMLLDGKTYAPLCEAASDDEIAE